MVEEQDNTIQELEVPEYNLIEQNFSKLFYRIRAVTHPSVSRKDGNEIERSLLTRAVRADLLSKFNSIPKSDRQKREKILAEARDRDEIAQQYLNQRELSIDIPELGEQKARYTIVDPPESRLTPELESKPPIFLIPGASNDLDGPANLAQELSFLGRRVIVVAYPDSQLGEVTSIYAKRSSESTTYEPHVTFFKKAIRELTGDDNIELWGFSSGAPIAAEILNDSEFQEKTSNAVMLSPASTANQSLLQFSKGLGQEFYDLAKRFKIYAKYSLVIHRKTPDKPGQSALKSKILFNLINKVCRKGDFWNKAKVREGGKIILFSAGKDRLTKSYLSDEELAKNPRIEVISDPSALHATPLLEPSGVLQKVFEKQAS